MGHGDQPPVAGLRRALSPTFPAGEMVFFIPWRGVADDSGSAHFALGRRDAARPARADGEAAGGAVDFHFRDIPVRSDDGARAIGANEPRGRRRQHP